MTAQSFVPMLPPQIASAPKRCDIDISDSALHRAADSNEFRLHYQPVVSLLDGVVHGVEALLRWQHPAHGTLTADTFIEPVCRSGVLNRLLPGIIDQACHTAARVTAHGEDRYVAVNIDPQQLITQPVVHLVEKSLTETGVRADALVIEVTERTELSDDSVAVHTATELHDLGVQLALDDFGTGHSSLSRIKSFPAGKVKIDRSFVRDVVDDADDQAIVASVVLLARGLGLSCVAEGIEDSAQASVLAALGCTAGQGFLWGRAVAVPDLRVRQGGPPSRSNGRCRHSARHAVVKT
jgi:diguanylate cyclase